MKDQNCWSHYYLVSMATFPTHCDITMGVYCDVILSMLHHTFYEWGSHVEYLLAENRLLLVDCKEVVHSISEKNK